MLIDSEHHLDGPEPSSLWVRPNRLALVVSDLTSVESAVAAACMMSGGLYCHLLPGDDWNESWRDYVSSMRPDWVVAPPSDASLLAELAPLDIRCIASEIPAGWRYSPLLPQVLDGVPRVDWEGLAIINPSVSEIPEGVSRLQVLARHGVVPRFAGNDWAQRWRVDDWRLESKAPVLPSADDTPVIEWLVGRPQAAATEEDRATRFVSPLELTAANISPGTQTTQLLAKEWPAKWVNRVLVVSSGDSVADMCLFWNLRANRALRGALPVWLTPDQIDDLAMQDWLRKARRHQPAGWYAGGDEEPLYLLSASLDTAPVADLLTNAGVPARPVESAAWSTFFDPEIYPHYSRRPGTIHFDRGAGSFVLSKAELPSAAATEVTVDLELPRFSVPPGGWDHNIGGHVVRVGPGGMLTVPVHFSPSTDLSTMLSVNFRPTERVIRGLIESRGMKVREDRKSRLARGLQSLLRFDPRSYEVLRSRDVVGLIREMTRIQQGTDRATNRYVPAAGFTFGDAHKALDNNKLAGRLLQWLLRGRLIFRGLTVDCELCGTIAWYSLSDIGAEFRCVGCGVASPFSDTPDTARWVYRVNEQLAASVDQGILQEVLFAQEFRQSGRFTHDSYLVPNLIVEKQNGEEIELDLFGFGDSKAVIAECKASGTATPEQLASLRVFGNELRIPFKLVLVCAADSADEEQAALADEVWLWDRVEPGSKEVTRERLFEIL